jgi:hypothetical protein
MDDSLGDIIGIPNGSILNVHDESKCRGRACCIHNPSDHALKDAPLQWRSDSYLMERVCKHGIGHPDPDHLTFLKKVAPELAKGQETHGCDFCCAEPDPEDRTRAEKLIEMVSSYISTSYLGDPARSPWSDDPDGGEMRIVRALANVLEELYDAEVVSKLVVAYPALVEAVEKEFFRPGPPPAPDSTNPFEESPE